MQTSKILNTVQSHIVFHKSLFGDDDRNFKGTSLNVSPLQVIEEFETFNEFSLGPLQKMLVQSKSRDQQRRTQQPSVVSHLNPW